MKVDHLTFCILAGGLLISTSLLTSVFSLSLNKTPAFGNKLIPPCPDNYTGFLRNEEDCHSFYICDHGYPGLIPCPSNLCFCLQDEKCERCELVPGCEFSSVSPTTSTTTTTEATTSTTTPTPTTTTSTTTVKTTTTSPTTVSTTTVTTTSPSTTTPVPELVCPPDVPFVLLEFPGNCSLFYQCEHGVYIATHECDPGSWFKNGIGCWIPWADECDR